MEKLNVFKAAMIATASFPFLADNVFSQSKPNIILIISDQHRWDAMHCMGNEYIKTPHLDELAADGTLFMNAYSSTPSSTPARAGLLTGLSPWHHGMLGYGRVGLKYKFEMPQMLRDNGYFTFGIGKMHWFPQKSLHGFHGTLVDESGRVESPDFISDYRLWFNMHAPGLDPDSTGIGWNDHGAAVYKLREELHPTAWTGEMARRMIENHRNGNGEPLFLKVSFARPHSPYDPPRRFADMYSGKDVPEPFIGEWCKDKPYSRLIGEKDAASDAPYANFGPEYAENSRRHYYANVTFIDEEIGKIIQALKDEGMYENSIICYVSDHGDMLGDHNHWRKTYPYEGSVHIPYIVKWPESYGFPKGGRNDRPVELRDLLPTFLDVAGSEIPDGMDGMSLVDLMNGNDDKWRTYIDLEHATCYSSDNYWCALTDGKIKYVWRFSTGGEELYDLVKDPGELVNVVSEKKYGKILAELRKEMINHLSERGEEFVKDGQLQVLKRTVLYSPNFPDKKPVDTGI